MYRPRVCKAQEESHTLSFYGIPHSYSDYMEAEAVRKGEKARVMEEFYRGEEEQQRSIRRRLASTLVQLGVRLDPNAADFAEDD
jgi:hypothetical protein